MTLGRDLDGRGARAASSAATVVAVLMNDYDDALAAG
jgi:hypothetical protein